MSQHNEIAAANNIESQGQAMDVRMLAAWMDNVQQYAENENTNNIDTTDDFTDDSTDSTHTDDGYTSDDEEFSDSDISDSEDEVYVDPELIVDVCKVLDTDEYQEEIAPERVEMILNLIEHGAIILDNTDPRFTDEKNIEKIRNQRRMTTEEISVIIDIQEGREPCCSPEVLEAVLEKISSGQYISFDYENTEVEDTEVADTEDEVAETENTEVEENNQTWFGWAFGTNQQQTQQTEQPKQEGTSCIMM